MVCVKSTDELMEAVPDDRNARVIISSVNESSAILKNKFRDFKEVFVLDHTSKIPIKSLYRTPETLGMDRLAAAIGANFLYGSDSCLIIDAGSCITYDLVDANGNYQGGSISPGIGIRFRSLHAFTSKLPLLEFEDFSEKMAIDLIGKTTEESILSGVINGIFAELNTIVLQYRELYPGIRILICGGDANYFESKIKQPIFAIPELVHWGLNRILEYNESEF